MRSTDSAERVVAVLDALASSPEGLGVTDVARELSVHKTTASRLLATLARSGLLEREPTTRRYLLGARLVSLAGAAVSRLPVVSQARPELEELTRASAETSNLAVLDRYHVVYVDQVMPSQAVVLASWVGRRSPAHASSSGKVLLAFGDGETVERLLERRLEPLTPQTIADPDEFRAVLEATRRRGFAYGIGELEDGLTSIAAPVLIEGRAVAAVSLSGPSYRIPRRDVPNLARRVVTAAGAIANRMRGRVSS